MRPLPAQITQNGYFFPLTMASFSYALFRGAVSYDLTRPQQRRISSTRRTMSTDDPASEMEVSSLSYSLLEDDLAE